MDEIPPELIKSVLNRLESDAVMYEVWTELEEMASAEAGVESDQRDGKDVEKVKVSQSQQDIEPIKQQITGIHLEFVELVTLAVGQMAKRVREVGLIETF